MDPISKWLIITRSAVFSMTPLSGMIGGLLAIPKVKNPNCLNYGLAVVGMVLAHASTNMPNDPFHVEGVLDNDAYA